MEKTADAVVIGGGIMGVSVAHFLAKKKIGKVVLLEKQILASVSTGGSAANIRSAYSNPLTIKLAMRALEMFENDKEELGGQSGFCRTGMMALLGEKHLNAGMEVLKQEIALNTGSKRISIEDAKELAPKFNYDGLIAATYQSRAGYADPILTTRTLAESAINKWGLVIHERLSSTGFKIENNNILGVKTPKGIISTPIVINATGPWGRQVGSFANKNYSIRWSREGDLVKELPNNFGSFPIIADPTSRIYFRPHKNNMLLAGRDYPKEIEPLDINNYNSELDDYTLKLIEEGLFKRIPSIQSGNNKQGWSSIYTITDDWHPLVGPDIKLNGYFTCFGGSGHSFKLGPPIGESLADIILGIIPKIDIRDLRSNRFEDGESFSSAWGSGNRA